MQRNYRQKFFSPILEKYTALKKLIFTLLYSIFLLANVQASGDGDHSHWHLEDCHGSHDEAFDASGTALHHIGDANVYDFSLFLIKGHMSLPCILYAPGDGPNSGLSVFSSGKFKPVDGHGNGMHSHKGYVLLESKVHRVYDPSFPDNGTVECYTHKKENINGKEKEVLYVKVNGKEYPVDVKSTLDGGMVGGGITSFYDFSITKNVFAMILVSLLLGWIFIGMARKYKRNEGKAPSGIQGFFEPLFVFIKEDVAVPMIGHKKYLKFMPYLMAIFFFILFLNLFGQIPFLGNANVTGNIGFTLVLAIITFLITNFNGNKDYWKHVLWMPGIPAWVKMILTPIEIIGLVLKPFTLLVRLFANITAGHIVILSFVSLIFLLGNSGANPAGGWGGSVISTLLTLFMMCIELLVAFIQAFIFTILSASYIGAAVEEHHH